MKPAPGAPILDPSVEAEGRATDLCTDQAPHNVARERILAWLAEGAREVTWALCWLPREHWAEQPSVGLDNWPVLRHVRHLVLQETHQILPAVRQALGEAAAESPVRSAIELQQAEATWDTTSLVESAEGLVRGLAESRFELLHRLEAAPDAVWLQPLPVATAEACGVTSPVGLDWLLLSARQHEQQHVAAVWKIALNWDRVPRTAIPGVPLHPADRLEESH
ncbi:MAG: hypothetical protein JO057_20780 [Chloroflexi bacterium]|nr:hypothetical protein [Chloroflexota bacterium]